MYKKIFLLLLIIGILNTKYCILDTPRARAEELYLGISPPLLIIEADPPASILSTPITVQNLSNEPVVVGVIIRPFTAKDTEDGQIEFLPDGDPFPGPDKKLNEKIQLLEDNNPIDSMLLAPQQERVVKLKIDIPADEPAADYSFSLVFVSGQGQTQGSGAGVAGGIATNVLLSIGPKGETKGVIEEFSTPIFAQRGPVSFTVRVKNTSNHTIAPNGGILLTNMFGQTIGKVELLPVNILPDTIRAMPDNEFSDEGIKRYSNTTKNGIPTAVWGETFLLGPYSAKLSVALSDKGPIVTKTIHFFAFPLEGLFTLVLIVGITTLVVIRVRKRFK